MPPKQQTKKSCFICLRSIENDHLLGPLITTKTITAHFLCVLFNPVTPDADDFAGPEKDGGMCGLSARYIREQAGRAAKLKCNFCKRNGANAGCCFDIGTDEKEKYCPKKYHIDCGHEGGASFNVSKSRGAVSVCFDHRGEIERAPERSNLWLQHDDNEMQSSSESSLDECASSNLSEAAELEGAVGYSRAEIKEDDVEYLDVEYLVDEHQIEFLDVQPIDSGNDVVKNESFDLNPIRESLDASNDSDCVVVAEYEETIQTGDE